MSTAIMQQSALYDFGELFMKVRLIEYFLAYRLLGQRGTCRYKIAT